MISLSINDRLSLNYLIRDYLNCEEIVELENVFPGFITVRTSSSRLPGKCLLPFGDETVIEHVINRAKNSGIFPIVCTSKDKSDDELENIAIKLGVACYRGSLNNKIKRWVDCAECFNISAFHAIDADDPFFDGSRAVESLLKLKAGSLDVVYPPESSSAGAASVGFSFTKNILQKAIHGLTPDTDTEMAWYFLEKIEGLKSDILIDNEAKEASNIRLTLDYEEDYWLLASLARILGNDVSRQDIIKFFRKNPDFTKINLFRNTEWKASQNAWPSR